MPYEIGRRKGPSLDLYGDSAQIFKTSEEAGSEVRSGVYRSPFADPQEQEKSRLGIGERIDAGVSALGERMFGKPEVNPADINQAGLQSVAARNAEIDRRAAAYRAEIEQRNGLERAIGAVVDPIAAGIANTVGGVAGYAGRKFGIQALQDIEMKAAADAKALMGNDPNLAQKVLQGVGSAGAGVATAIPAAIGAMYAGAPLGVATTIGALASTAVNQSGVAQEAYRGAMEATGNEKVADVRGDTAAAATMIPNFFLDKFGVKLGLGAAAGTSMTARAGRVTGAGLLEGAQEGFVEQPAINIASYRPAGEGVAESALVGGLSGAAVRGAQEIGMRGGQQQQDPLANLPEQNIDQVVPGSQARAAQEPGKPLPDVFVVTPDGTAIPAQDFSPEAYDRYKRSQQGDPVPLLGFSQPEGNRRFLLTDQRSGEQIVVLPDGTAIPRSEFNQAEYDSLVSARDDRIQRGLLLAYSPESDRPFFVAPDGNAFRSYVDYRSHVAELAQNTEDQRMAALAAQKTPRVRLNELETTDNASVLVFDKGRNGVLGTIQPGAKTVEIDGTRVPITKSMTFIPVEEKILRTREEIRAENSPAFDVQLPMDFAFQGAPKADSSVTGTVKQVSYGLSLVADQEIPGRLRPVRHTDVLINGKMVRLPGTLPQEAVGQKLRISTAKGSDGVRYGVESTQLQKPVVARSGKPQALPNVSTSQQVPALPSATQEVQPVTEAQAPAPIVKTVKKTPSRAIATGVQPLNYQDGTRGAMVRMDNGSAIEIQEQGNQWVDTTGQVLGNNLEQAVQAVQTRERKGGEVAQTTNERLETVSQQQAGTPTEPEAATKAKQISKGKRNATQKGKQQQNNQQQRQEDRGRVETGRDDRQQQTEEQGKSSATSGSDRPAKSKEEIKKERLERINAAQRAKNPDYGKKIGDVTVAAFKRISARIEDTWNAFVRALDGMARAAEQRNDGARTGRDTEEATVVRSTQRLDTALREVFGNDAEIARLRLQQNENAANLVREKLENGKLAVPGNVDRGVLKALEPTELLEKLGTGRTELEARMQSLIELASRPNPTPLMQAVIRSKTKDIQAAIARYKGIPEDQRQQAFDDLRQLATARSNIRNQTPEVAESKRARAVEQDKDQNNQMALALQRAFTGESEKPMDPRDLRDTMKNGPIKDVPTVKEISAARELYDENRADNQPTFDRFVKDEPLLAAAWIDAVNSSPAYSSIAYFDDLQARYNKNQRATKSNEKVAENRVAAVEGAKNDVITDRYLAIVKKSLSRTDNQVLNDVYGDAKQSTLRSGFAKDLLAFYNGEKVDPRVEAIIKKVDKVIKAADVPSMPRTREEFWGGDIDNQFFDADLSGRLETTNDIRDVLEFIYRASPNADMRSLAKQLMDAGVQGDIRMVDQKENPDGRAADSNHLLQRIRLFGDVDLEHNIMHEAVHLATMNGLLQRTPAARALEKLYEQINKNADAKPYGLKNVKEFVAELKSNPDFQEFLAKQPGGGFFRTMFDRVVNAVRRVIGLEPRDNSALKRAMMLSDQLIKEDRELTAKGSIAMGEDVAAHYSRPVEVYAYDKNGDVVGLAQMDPSSGDWRVFLSQSGDIRKTSNYTTQLFNKTDDAIKAMRGPGIRLVRRKESPARGSVSPGDMVEISTDVVPSNKISAAIDAALGKMGIRPDNVRRLITDSEIDIRSVIDNLRKDGHAVGSDLDFYAALTRTPGATGAALDKFNRQFVEPLEKTYAALMKKGVTAKEINQYLTAKHAEERNDVIAQRNPAMPDGGSGMTTADARALLQSFAGRSYAADLDALSKIFEDMSDFKVKLMQDKGLIDSKTAASLKKYKNYVNLRGLDEDPEEIHAAVGIAKKPGPALKTAKGRATEAANIIQNTILDAEAVILKAYQNEARQSLLKLAEKFPDPDFWVVAPIKSRMVIDKKTGNVRFAGDPTLANSVHSAEIFVDGELVRVEMKDAHFATAVNKAADKLPDVVDKVAKVLAAYNRWKAMLLTQLNPEWAITNAFRDAGAAIANVKVDEAEKQIPQETLKEAAKSYASSMREMFKYVRDPDNAPGAVAAKIRRFEELGGTTKFFGLNDIEQKLNKFRDLEAKAQNKGVRGKALNLIEKSKVGNLLDVIMDLNSTVEMLPRFAAFDALTKLGVDDQTAATYAKNLNVNFNRRGELGWLSNVYLFFNAAVQGNVRTVKALGTKTGGAIAGGLFVAGLIEAAIGHALDDDENDNGKPDIEELSDYDRNTNIVIPVGGNNYFKIPLPYGFNAIKAAGSHMGDSIWGTKSPVKAAWATLRAFSDAYNPIGAGDSSSAANTAIKMISPEITDPIVEYALNENRYGAPIRKENRPGMPSLPDSELYFDSVSGVSKAVSSFLNSATGGNKFVSGAIDINPAAIDQFFGAILPGTPSVVTRGVNTAVKAATSEAEIEIREIPFVRRVLTEPAKASTYKDYSEVKALIDQLKNIDNNGVREQRQKLKEFPGWRGVEAQLDAAESVRKDLVTRKQSIRNGDVKVADKDLEIQKIDEKILKLENRVLKRYNAVSDAW